MPKKTVQWDSQENKPKKSRYTRAGLPSAEKSGCASTSSPCHQNPEPRSRCRSRYSSLRRQRCRHRSQKINRITLQMAIMKTPVDFFHHGHYSPKFRLRPCATDLVLRPKIEDNCGLIQCVGCVSRTVRRGR